MKMAIAAPTCLFLASCITTVQPSDQIPIPDACTRMCATMADEQCDGWQGSPGEDERFGTKDDVPCNEACEQVVSADPTMEESVQCGASAESCSAIENCQNN